MRCGRCVTVGAEVFAPYPGCGVGDPVDAARRGVEHARRMNNGRRGRVGFPPPPQPLLQLAQVRARVSPSARESE